MKSKIALWSGNEAENPNVVQNCSGTLHTLNDSWGIASNNGIAVQILFPNTLKNLKISTSIVQACCNKSCALIVDSEGQVLGFNTHKSTSQALRIGSSNEAIKIDGLSNIIQVSLGKTHAAAIDKEGKLYTWGIGEDHQLGDLLTTTHGPIPVQSAEIFNAQQVICGEKHTSIRTLGGFVYTFGTLNHSQRCKSPIVSKMCPYTLQELENHFITDICGRNFIAALTATGVVFIFDACGKLVKLSLYQKEILSIAATENSVIGLDKGCLYQWKEISGENICGLMNWSVNIILLENNYIESLFVSGFERNVGIMCKSPKGAVGKVIKVAKESEDIQVPDNFIENREVFHGTVDRNVELGLQIFIELIDHKIRLTFQKLNNKIDYSVWNPEEKPSSEDIKKLIQILQSVFQRQTLRVFKIFQKNSSSKTCESLSSIVRIFNNYQLYHSYAKFGKKCLRNNKIHQKNVKQGLLIMTIILRCMFLKSKSSTFINLLRFKKIRQGNTILKEVLTKILNSKMRIHIRHLMHVFNRYKMDLLADILILNIRKSELSRYKKLCACFQFMKHHDFSGLNSFDSQRSSEFLNLKSNRIKYSLTLSLPDKAALLASRNADQIHSPYSSNRLVNQSPRSPQKKLNKKEQLKAGARANSKTRVIEKFKNPEIRTKLPSKASSTIDEIKARQAQQNLLRVSAIGFKGADWEKSYEKIESPTFAIAAREVKLRRALSIVEEKIQVNYHSVLQTLQSTLNPKPLNAQATFLAPSVSPEMWKRKVFSIGISKISAMLKKRMRAKVLTYLFS